MCHDAKQSGCFAPNQNKYDEALSEYKNRWRFTAIGRDEYGEIFA